ncbi:hypothetical protein Palpr_0526 [Paludibacter propionicigenes WB4]|uniref:Uncharacterized protein n=1 Tax=Paludibacter propionicigenes (strain DSM 17365 / JCM 13257 / WB4) TaxID=694427 RepID=E4T1U1_PALPW|nr:hypothetical protein Palpr_0526 [Paludibacter propionicigenes WB4]
MKSSLGQFYCVRCFGFTPPAGFSSSGASDDMNPLEFTSSDVSDDINPMEFASSDGSDGINLMRFAPSEVRMA